MWEFINNHKAPITITLIWIILNIWVKIQKWFNHQHHLIRMAERKAEHEEEMDQLEDELKKLKDKKKRLGIK
jgi:hypothetical protein